MSRRDLRLLEGAALGAFVVVIVAAFFASSLARFVIGSNQAAAVESAVLVDLTNQNRQGDGLSDLTVSPVLVAAAQAKANDEAAKGYFAHVSPDGHDSWYWFQQAGYSFTYAGENLAVDFTDSDAVDQAWMNSPEHRANILNGHFTQIGIATAQGSYEGHPTIFVVQMFGAPAHTAAAATAPITEVTTPSQPTDIAIATTQATPTPAVLGQEATPAVKPPAKRPTVVAPAPVSTPAPAAKPAPQTPVTVAVAPVETATPQYASFWDFLLASPKAALRDLYYELGLLVLLSLLVTTGFEFKRHHVRQAFVAGGLLVVMCGLFIVADTVVFTQPTVAQAATTDAG
jgi:uncharacterized protein YkwD